MGIIKTIGFQGSLTGYAVPLLFLEAAPHSTHAREDKLHCFHVNVIVFQSEHYSNKMNDTAAVTSDIAIPDMQKFMHEGLSYNTKDMERVQNALKVSYEVDMTLALFSEKLTNMEDLLSRILLWENDIGSIPVEDDNISAELIEKALMFDLLCAFLCSEVRELDNLMGDLQDTIVNALNEISSCGQPTELLTGLESKLRDSEELLKQSQEQVQEIKIQLAKLQMSSFSSKQNEWKYDLVEGLNEEFHLESTEFKPQMQTMEQRRVLRMLEKSLARELGLEKKLTGLKQNEEDLKLKIRLTEQVAVRMEEAAEAAWSRFLEAENTAEVLTGISKEMAGRLQIVRFNLNGSTNKEEEMKSKLQDCIDQLNDKEFAIGKLNSSISQLIADNSEVTHVREQFNMLGEKLNETESQLKKANASSETSQLKLKEMEGEIQSLRETIYDAESRAESAETKVTYLTETNMELTEELGFLRGSNDSNTKKASILEKQLRELDIQLQHARASSEASQEQQNMLYSAIWDMEILIDELKQKVANAESKTESAENRCIILSDTNSELNEELDFLRARMEFLEKSINQETIEKNSCMDDINIKTDLIMDMVTQLALERERIHKQLYYLTKENKLLREKFQESTKLAPVVQRDNSSSENKEFPSSGLNSLDAFSTRFSAEMTTPFSSKSFQAQQYETTKDAYVSGTKFLFSGSYGTNKMCTNHQGTWPQIRVKCLLVLQTTKQIPLRWWMQREW
ncbi:WPP domain-interacting tail-anchored protein 2-like isoform X2 [Olea europaea var. sylvestris]|uniref:WPP domain-interacting tail-anchored protein 2-like isoform X2 n=1 Tax=Olea europaea var. sylvestris TaxID=158386 RepID=UPI000C1D5B03|nr:WPP domain-interacting tail-anchored protein 2-like isoform X2 [Olea europaea var. sylvestris]